MDDHHLGEKIMPLTSVSSKKGEWIAGDIYYFPIQIVNVIFVGKPVHGGDWTLIDAGMPRSADAIIEEAEKLYGKANPPNAIILTHGHFDHVGSIVKLIEHWNKPVFAHHLELPYLTGFKDYPKPDASVEGGLVAKLSGFFPHSGIDLTGHISDLPGDYTVPGMDGWKWIHTPGHTEGHISLFRERDRAMIAGDAFVTVKQESLYQVLTQHKVISGPPRYLTTDWEAARHSVTVLKSLRPSLAVTGHGHAMSGQELTDNLALLVKDFDIIAKPDYGKYVNEAEGKE
ncbi:MBL fold metallo-hydrolase [Bacillus massiliglaciei]|uniref:MBL fold metallo-hydrolase n=1 Tax=Bacillus massiliglaciei TaxID=1816693 RepID=UPI000AA0800C|nr:MBL fold metallo-hydrolase [Bacillus massiliglaciei]